MKKFKDYEELIDKNLNYLKNNKLGYFIDSQKNTLKKKLNTDDIFRHLDESIKIKEEKISIIYNDVNENTQKNIEKLESSKKELELLISKINEDIKEDKNYYNNQLKDFDNIVANLKDKNEIYVKSYQELLRLKKYLNKNINFFDSLSKKIFILMDKNNYDNTFSDFEKLTNEYYDYSSLNFEKQKKINMEFFNVYTDKINNLIENMKNKIISNYKNLCKRIKNYYIETLKNNIERLKKIIDERIDLKKEYLFNSDNLNNIISELEDIVILYNIENNKLSSSINEAKKYIKYIKIEIINAIEKEQSSLFDTIKEFKNNVFNNYINKIKSYLENYVDGKTKLLDEYISTINENNIIDKYNNVKSYYENISKDLEKTIKDIKKEINILESFENKYKLGNIKPNIEFKVFNEKLFKKYKENYEIILRKLINITLKKLESDFVVLEKKNKKDYIFKYIKDVKEIIDKYNSEFSLNYKYSYYFDDKKKLEDLVNDYLNDIIYYYFEKLKNQKDGYQFELNSINSNNIFELIEALKLYKAFSKNLKNLKGDYNNKIKELINEIKKEVKGFDIKIIKNKLNFDLTLDISEIINKIKSLLPVKEKELNQKIDNIYNSKIEEINKLKTINAEKINNIIDDYYNQYNQIKYEMDSIVNNLKDYIHFRPNLKVYSIEDYIKNHIEKLQKDTIEVIENYHNEYKSLLKAILSKNIDKIKDIEYRYNDFSKKIKDYINYNNEIRINIKLNNTKIKYWYKTSYGLNMINKTNISKKNIFSRIIIVFKIMLRGGKNDSNSMDN